MKHSCFNVKDYISKCANCHTSKAQNAISRPPMLKPYIVQRPFQKLYVDFLGPYPRSKQGHIGIFLVLDSFTKFVLIKPVKKFTAEPICNFLEENVFSIFGTPEIIFSDNGKQFKSKQFENLVQTRGIKHQFTALYSPQANASERVNRSIITGIRLYLKGDQKQWDKNLATIGEALRSAHHQTIGCSPYYTLTGQQMITHGKDYELLRKLSSLDEKIIDRHDSLSVIRKAVQDNITKAFEKSAQRYNLRSNTRHYQPGDVVYRRNFVLSDATKHFNAKLAPKYIRSEVISIKGNALLELKDEGSNKMGIYHLKDIKPIMNET